MNREELRQVRDLAKFRVRAELLRLLDLSTQSETVDERWTLQQQTVQQEIVRIAQRKLEDAETDLLNSS